MMDPYDKTHVLYDKHLGFVPCRGEKCKRVEVHPAHPMAPEQLRTRTIEKLPEAERERVYTERSQARAERWQAYEADPEKQQARELRYQQKRQDELRQTLARHGYKPTHVWHTESGEVFAEEWTCPRCRGARRVGAHVCARCRGRGVLVAKPEEIFAILTKQGDLR